MATRLISGEDVDARIRAAQASKATAEQELREAEANFAATAVSESLDELKLAYRLATEAEVEAALAAVRHPAPALL